MEKNYKWKSLLGFGLGRWMGYFNDAAQAEGLKLSKKEFSPVEVIQILSSALKEEEKRHKVAIHSYVRENVGLIAKAKDEQEAQRQAFLKDLRLHPDKYINRKGLIAKGVKPSVVKSFKPLFFKYRGQAKEYWYYNY